VTVTTVGYGDITPSTDWERVYSTAVCFVGTIAFAYMTSQITAVVFDLSAAKRQVRQKMEELEEFMTFYQFSKSLRMDIRAFYKARFQSSFFDADKILHGIPAALQQQASYHLRRYTFSSVPMLSNAPVAFIDKLLRASTNLTEMQQGEFDCIPASAYLFIEKGLAVVRTKTKDSKGRFRTNAEPEEVGENKMWHRQDCSVGAEVQVEAASELLTFSWVSREKWADLMSKYPHFNRSFGKKLHQQERTRARSRAASARSLKKTPETARRHMQQVVGKLIDITKKTSVKKTSERQARNSREDVSDPAEKKAEKTFFDLHGQGYSTSSWQSGLSGTNTSSASLCTSDGDGSPMTEGAPTLASVAAAAAVGVSQEPSGVQGRRSLRSANAWLQQAATRRTTSTTTTSVHRSSTTSSSANDDSPRVYGNRTLKRVASVRASEMRGQMEVHSHLNTVEERVGALEAEMRASTAGLAAMLQALGDAMGVDLHGSVAAAAAALDSNTNTAPALAPTPAPAPVEVASGVKQQSFQFAEVQEFSAASGMASTEADEAALKQLLRGGGITAAQLTQKSEQQQSQSLAQTQAPAPASSPDGGGACGGDGVAGEGVAGEGRKPEALAPDRETINRMRFVV
jgi:hypothetical protein